MAKAEGTDAKKAAEAAKNGTNTAAVAGKIDENAAQGVAPAKSIIGAKYRDGRYKTADWLAEQIAAISGKTKSVTKNVKTDEEGGTKAVTSDVADGIDVDKLFALASANGLDVTKFQEQRNSHGFPGRFRMTVRNMLQASIKRRHGYVGLDGKFVSAPAEWLTAKGAPEKPTHNQDGTKIPVAKPAAPEAAAPEAAADAAKADPKTKK